jgi:hypothetical protein
LAGNHSSTVRSGVTTGTFGITTWIRSSIDAMSADV